LINGFAQEDAAALPSGKSDDVNPGARLKWSLFAGENQEGLPGVRDVN
jgi:hypothetical protein